MSASNEFLQLDCDQRIGEAKETRPKTRREDFAYSETFTCNWLSDWERAWEAVPSGLFAKESGKETQAASREKKPNAAKSQSKPCNLFRNYRER